MNPLHRILPIYGWKNSLHTCFWFCTIQNLLCLFSRILPVLKVLYTTSILPYCLIVRHRGCKVFLEAIAVFGAVRNNLTISKKPEIT
jgi:hypothetical protein